MGVLNVHLNIRRADTLRGNRKAREKFRILPEIIAGIRHARQGIPVIHAVHPVCGGASGHAPRAVIDRYHDLLNLADMGVHLRIHLREELRAPVAYDLGGLLRGGYAGIRHGVEHGWHKEPRQHADYRHDHNKLNKGEPLF